MEADKHYFIEGLFVIGLAVGAALFFVWLGSSGERDDVLYRIHFAESVSGLGLGEPVKFQGVDVGTVKQMAVDPANPRRVEVLVKLRKHTPVKTDTRASLRLKGITGIVFVELDGGSATAQNLLAATPAGQIPEIPSEKSELATVLEQLPAVIEKFSAVENKASRVLSDVGELTAKLKKDPSLLLRRPKDDSTSVQASEPAPNKPPPRVAGHP
jgi:phospholipid/cholesterol/gamma-HCH transport system substrate-binding protein